MIPYLAGSLAAVIIGAALHLFFGRIDPQTLTGYAGCRGWCEGALNGCGGTHPTRVPEQPVNTYTNLIYAAVGVFCGFYFRNWSAHVFMLAMVALCLGSSLYHGLSTVRSGRFDVGAMYAVFATIGMYSLATATGASDGLAAIMMLTAGAAFGFAGFWFKGWYRDNVNWKIAVFLVVSYIVLLERIVTHGRTAAASMTLSSLALFVLAMGIWRLDRSCEFPLKRWGHGLWHLLTGIATAVLYCAIWATT